MAAYEEKEYNNPFSVKVCSRILPYMKPYAGRFFIALFFMVVLAGIDIALPMLQKYAIDTFIAKDTLQGIWHFLAALIAIILVQTACVTIFVRNTMFVEMSIGKDLKRVQFLHLQQLSLNYYNTTPVGYIIARVMSDTLKIAGMISWGLIDLFWSSVYVVGVFVAMFFLNPTLALAVVIVVPLIAIATFFFQRIILKYNRKVRKINSQITGAYNEGILGAKTSKTLVMEDLNHSGFSDITGNMYHASVRAAVLNAIFIPLVLVISSFTVSLVLYNGGHMTAQQLLEISTLSVFLSYATGIFEPIQQIARIIADVISAQANIERIMDLMAQEPNVSDSPEICEKYGDSFTPKRENWEKIRGDIEFVDVSFKYPDGTEYVLEHFNLKVPHGTNVAIVGQTGAGKSTLVNLACRFFEPTSGKILIDGVDYRERSQLWLQSNIGYVLQSPHLFSGTIRDNIRYGNLNATDDDIVTAAKAVCADKVVEKLKDGYDSDVGEGGDMLSTGEKQLISFARAIISDPAIFVLDEATSSIDTHTEQLIQSATNNLLKDRTSFVIAHRLSTIKSADIILVVEDGKIIERGTHKELILQGGHYYNLYNNQFEEEAQSRIWQSQQ